MFSLIEKAGLAFLYSSGLQARITQEDKAMVGVFCTHCQHLFWGQEGKPCHSPRVQGIAVLDMAVPTSTTHLHSRRLSHTQTGMTKRTVQPV